MQSWLLCVSQLAARGMKVGMAAGSVAVVAAAETGSSTSESPPPQPAPSQPDPPAKAPVLPETKPSTTAISMTAALKNVGAVSIFKVYQSYGFYGLRMSSYFMCLLHVLFGRCLL